MAYQTGTATGIEDLIDKLTTFAAALTTTPWTLDEFSAANNMATIHRSDCYVSFRWDTTSSNLALYQSLGFSAGTEPHLQLDDSGNGSTYIPIGVERRVNFETLSAFPSYHLFAGEGSTPYIHVVVEVSSGVYRHFGFGNLSKVNDWVGGEYVYGGYWNQSTSYIDNPQSTQHAYGLDFGSSSSNAGTLHVEGLPNQDVSSKWGVFTSAGAMGTDTAGNSRICVRGGARGGFWGYHLSWLNVSQLNSYKPLIPIEVVYYDTSGTTPAWRWLGSQPDVAIINIKSLVVASEVVVGSDTWVVFPWTKKQYTNGNTEESWNAGFAYKKVV